MEPRSLGVLELAREYLGKRTLVWVLTRRMLIARYRGTGLGFLWTFLHPLLLFSVYAVVFGVFVRVDVANYPAFLIAGLLPWSWFASSLSIATTSILGDAPWVRQASVSPAISPLVVSNAALLNFLYGVPVILAILAALGVWPSPWLALLPVVVAVQFLFCLGLSLATSALSVRYRDTIQIVQALLPLWFFLTPVIYPASMVPDEFAWLVLVNPMAHLAEAYQAVLFQGAPPSLRGLGIGLAWAVAALLVGQRVLAALRDRIPEEL